MEPAWEKVQGRKFALLQKTYQLPNGGTKMTPYYSLTKTECLYIATKFNDEALIIVPRACLVSKLAELVDGMPEQFIVVPDLLRKLFDNRLFHQHTVGRETRDEQFLYSQQLFLLAKQGQTTEAGEGHDPHGIVELLEIPSLWSELFFPKFRTLLKKSTNILWYSLKKLYICNWYATYGQKLLETINN